MQQLRRLSGRRAARQEAGAFVIDGPTLLGEALGAGQPVLEVFTDGSTDPALLARARAAGAAVYDVSPQTLARAVDTVTPHGVAAIAARTPASTEAVLAAAAAGSLALVLCDVSDPGNAGTLLRAAEAAGAAAVLFCGTSVDPTNAKCVRASAGALFHVEWAEGEDAEAMVGALRAVGVRTAASVVRGGRPYDSADLRGPVALFVGSEAHGLPPAVADAVDLPLTIPMVGRSESLNVAMAGTVLCFEALRQRRAAQ